MYDVKSLKAEEFINDEEILATLEYAEQNKNNRELIEQILEKAKPQKTGRGVECAGLTHREASVLLACDIPEMIEKMYDKLNIHNNNTHHRLFPPLLVQDEPFEKNHLPYNTLLF